MKLGKELEFCDNLIQSRLWNGSQQNCVD